MKRAIVLLLCICFLFSILVMGCDRQTENLQENSSLATETALKDQEGMGLKISCWGIETDPNSKIIKEAVELYNQKNGKNATVEFTEQEQYKTKIAAQVAANEAPDIFNIWAAGFLKPYVRAGKVFSLSEALDKDPSWKNRYIPGVTSPLTLDGKIYALPMTQTVVCLFYNKEIFGKYGLQVPSTYEDLKKVIETLDKNKITPFAFGNKAPWVGAMMSELIANRIGGSKPFIGVYNGTGTWEDPSYIETGKIMSELVKMNAFPKEFNALDNEQAQALFKQGRAAMLVMGSWVIQQLITEDTAVKGKIDVAKFPVIEKGNGSADNWLGQPDQNFAISQRCEDKDAALAFIKTMSDPEIQDKLAEAGNLVATNIRLEKSEVNPLTLKAAYLQKNMKELFIFYDVGLGAAIGNEFNNTIQAITAGISPEEAFRRLQQFTEKNKEQ